MGLRAVRLRCEYADNPLGIDTPRPRLSWVVEAVRSDERGQRQSAYQVLVAGTEAALKANRGDLWDSGKVASARSLHVVYGGKPLSSGQRVYWKVRVWDREDRPSRYSSPAWWEMALLHPNDWRARWVTQDRPRPAAEREMFAEDPAPLLRREFRIDKPVARARAYVSGLGYYELRLNGERVGDHLLDPGWTPYAKRVLYSTYDITKQLRPGANALGMMLGNGWYNPLPLRMWGHLNLREHLTIGAPRALLQLEVTYTDGTRQTVVTDETWRASDGPILRNSVYLGEVYDARREQPGWDRPGFDDGGWKPVVEAREPVGPLRAQTAPPIRVTRTFHPVRTTQPKPGVYIYDLGRNFAGRVVLRARGPAGTRVTLRYGELLYPDGTLNPMTSAAGQIKGRPIEPGSEAPQTAWQSDAYVLKGQGQETFTPRFTFHGFRYVEVTGYPGEPALDALTGQGLSSDLPSAAEFACSNPMLNQLQDVVRGTLLSNVFSVQSDCPHREKFGYGGDIVATSDMALLNYDMDRFYAKVVQDFADDVRPNGGFTETAPFVGIADAGLGEGSGPIGWGTAHPLLVWQLYQYYGDRRLLETQYDAARRWVRLLDSRARDGILENGISDHESLVPKPVALTGTAFYYLNLRLLERMAALLGHSEEARQFGIRAGEVRNAFNARFLQPGTGRYDAATQACQAFALALGLVPEEEREAALAVLVRNILEERKGHLSTGIFGTKYLLESLSELGRADVAYTVANQRDFPGWGHMLASGATTLWESWAFSDNTYSHNHPMFGSVSEWLLKWVAGIGPAPEAEGFDRVLVRPRVVGDLTWARARYDSARGEVLSAWRVTNGTLSLEVRVPVGATATVFVPTADASGVTEGGHPLSQAEGVRVLRSGDGVVVCQVGSGRYRFRSPAPPRPN